MTGANIPEIALLDVKNLAYLLVDGYWQVSVVDEIDSTQTYLKSKSAKHGEVIAAEFQSAGRGRLDRIFEANKSRSLLFSLYIEPKRNRDDWGWIPLLAGLAISNVLNREVNVFKTKWPNDLLAINSPSDGKVAGILSETSGNGVVVGIGINVGMSEGELPVPTATSLRLVGGNQLDRNNLLANILIEFADLFKRWESGEDLSDEYERSSSTIGRSVQVNSLSNENKTGLATGIGPKGELVLDGDQYIYSGDVIHLYT